jgi:hypothetical protein
MLNEVPSIATVNPAKNVPTRRDGIVSKHDVASRAVVVVSTYQRRAWNGVLACRWAHEKPVLHHPRVLALN